MSMCSDDAAPVATIGELCRVDGQDLVRIQLLDRSVLVPAKCPHRGADMSRAYVSGPLLICERHGATFDLRTGGWVRGPLCDGITVIDASAGDRPAAAGSQ